MNFVRCVQDLPLKLGISNLKPFDNERKMIHNCVINQSTVEIIGRSPV